MTKQKPLSKRAAEAIERKATFDELKAIRSEVNARLQELEGELKAAKRATDDAEGTGDPDKVSAAREAYEVLRDEERMLLRMRKELHSAASIARGQEAVQALPQHRKTLASALDKAEKARAMLAEAEQAAKEVIAARRAAHEIGERITFDRETIRGLAETLHPKGNASKQLMIDLGIGEASK